MEGPFAQSDVQRIMDAKVKRSAMALRELTLDVGAAQSLVGRAALMAAGADLEYPICEDLDDITYRLAQLHALVEKVRQEFGDA